MNLFKNLLRYFLLILFCFVWSGSQAVAQTNEAHVDTTLFRDLHFRQVGPLRGGRVATVSGIPGAQQSFYMGTAVASGVWRTDNYGRTWRKITDGTVFKTTAIGAIAVANSDSSTIYVGTGPCGIRDIVLTGSGMYRSTDSGKHWQFIGLGDAGQICNIEVDPRNPDRLFVAVLGHTFGKNAMRGIFRSTNGGKTWGKVLFASDSTGGVDVEFKPGNSDVLYAALWRAERKPWTIISGAAKEDGLYKSTDGGDHWHKLTNGLPTGLVGRIGIAVTPADPNRVYALIEAGGDSTGLYRSDDAGKHWEKVHDGDGIMNRPFYFTDIHVDPNDANTVYVGNVSFWKSEDGGKTFERIRVPHGDTHDLWINPQNSDIQILATDGGATVTVNGGKTWSTLLNQPTAELWQVNVDDRFPYWLYAGQQDRSSIVVPSLPPYPGPTGYNNYLRMMGGCETGPIVPVPGSPIVYANCKGRFGRYNKMTGQEQNYYIGARSMYGFNPKDLKFRFMRAAPIEVPPNNPNVVYMGAQYVFRSKNGGEDWKKISPDLTAFERQYQVTPGEPITRDVTGEENFSTLSTIQVSPLNGNIIWTGSNDGLVYISRDKGKSWTNVTPKKLLPNSRIEIIEPSHFEEGKAYIAVRRRYLDDFHPYIYRTVDYGQHWQLLTDGSNGIPAGFATRVIREDPKQEGLLYAGTDWGLFISFDDGSHWQQFKQDLSTTTIQDIAIHSNDLILATLGHGFVILDNLSVLRQLSQINPDGNYLFKPTTAYRMRYRGHSEIPQYPDPGIYIDFYLADKTQAPVVLKIKDDEGRLVRTFIGKFKKEEEGDQNEDDQDCIPASLVQTVPATAACFEVHPGHNRFRWNLRYPGKTIKAVEGNAYYGVYRGPLVVPGDYTIQVSTTNWSKRQPLLVKMDPRVKKSGVTLGDLQAQLELNQKIRDLIGRAKKVAAGVDSMRVKIKSKLKDNQSGQKKLQQKLNSLNKIYQALVTSDDMAYPPVMLINQAEYLYRMTSSADQRPGDFAYKRYKQLHEKFIELKAEWKHLK